MVSAKEEDSLTARIIELISHKPQTLVSLIGQTHSTSGKVSWICQNLRGKGIIDLDRDGVFYLSEVSPDASGQNGVPQVSADNAQHLS
ncbi:hypothetical protein HRE53_17855 [Acaryochloris sp. 'Moss Beach']|uniref:hypothetical protein n=1 Tax=Acaryochloris TaxID=155977 RepID=UPI001BAEE6C9|nr:MULTISPECIES: hypothetical protein [Acaryochloris]QUY43603.1 hypothetical protein I1H34_05570 [Acaryochloris marina S15]UJB68397.1 hypothetical protein HRE53_17855 [Acaryochloris sp. 'Moss Beach']